MFKKLKRYKKAPLKFLAHVSIVVGIIMVLITNLYFIVFNSILIFDGIFLLGAIEIIQRVTKNKTGWLYWSLTLVAFLVYCIGVTIYGLAVFEFRRIFFD